MKMHFSGGYNLQIAGKPGKSVENRLDLPKTIGFPVGEFNGFKPLLKKQEGEEVKKGDVILASKTDPRIQLVSPFDGKIQEVKRGERRLLLEVILEVSPNQSQESLPKLDVHKAKREEIKKVLLETGSWIWFREYPFNKVANPDHTPRDIFIQTLETEPWLPDLNEVLKGQGKKLQKGVDLLKRLTDGNVYFATARTDSEVPSDLKGLKNAVEIETEALYPASRVMTQAWSVHPVNNGECVWYINAQDLLAVVDQLETGKFQHMRVMSVAGSSVEDPHLVKTWIGAPISHLCEKFKTGEHRFVAGGIFTGIITSESGHLGIYGHGLHVLPEGNHREFLSFMMPGFAKSSFSKVFLSTIFPSDSYEMNSSRNGEKRACVQCAHCEAVCPVEIKPQFLFKALLAEDYSQAEELGLLDCADCGLCTYVCPSKIEIDAILRSGLNLLAKEG